MINPALIMSAALGDSQSLASLIHSYRPLFLSESRMYLHRMEGYDLDDFLSEASIVLWRVCCTYDERRGSFGALLKRAVRNRFCKLFQNYVEKSMVVCGSFEDSDGSTLTCYAVSSRADHYREMQKERNRRYSRARAAAIDAEREACGLEKVYRPSLATDEERAAHDAEVRARKNEKTKAYQREHREEIAAKKRVWYQQNKEKRRIQSAILRNKKAAARFEASGQGGKAQKALERLERYEMELAAIKG